MEWRINVTVYRFASGQWPPLRLRVCKWFNVYTIGITVYRRLRLWRIACKFICNYTVGAHSVRPHFVKWVRTNSEHHRQNGSENQTITSILRSPFSIFHSEHVNPKQKD